MVAYRVARWSGAGVGRNDRGGGGHADQARRPAAQSLPVRAAFTSDGKWILTAWQKVDQNEAPTGWEVRLDEAPIVTGSAPAWLIQLAEIAGGEQLDTHGVLQPTPSDKDSTQLRQSLLGLSGSDPVRWVWKVAGFRSELAGDFAAGREVAKW